MEPTILITNATLYYPSIYKATSAMKEVPPRHSVSMEVSDEWAQFLITEGAKEMPARDERPRLFRATSSFPPLVTPARDVNGGEFDKLVRAMQIADARNMPRDQLFRGMEVEVRVQFFDYAIQGHSGRAMGVREVIADADDLLHAAMAITEEEPTNG